MALGPEVYPKFSQIGRPVKDSVFHSCVFLKLEREKHWELSSLRLMHAGFILDRQPKLSLLLMWRVFSACTLESFGISIYQYPQQYPQHGPSHMWQGIILHFHALSIFMFYAFQCLIHHVPLFISLVLEISGCQGLMNQKTGNLTWHISYPFHPQGESICYVLPCCLLRWFSAFIPMRVSSALSETLYHFPRHFRQFYCNLLKLQLHPIGFKVLHWLGMDAGIPLSLSPASFHSTSPFFPVVLSQKRL